MDPTIDTDRLPEHAVQLGEIHPVGADPVDDQVGAMTEHPGSEDVEDDAADRRQDDDGDEQPFGAEQSGEPADDLLQVLGSLGRHADRAETADRAGIVRRRRSVVTAIVDRGHAGSGAPSWEATISA